MCGIAGSLGANDVNEASVKKTLRSMARRGPDSSRSIRLEIGGQVCHLLHTRLAIIDLASEAEQPMRQGPLTLVFNGEIYNYLEVRRELEGAGQRFRTQSDSEVLLAAYLHWGTKALNRLEGMWAFAIHDARDGSLFLSRDRFGEKPLFLRRMGGTLYFASEPKALESLSGTPLSVDLAAVRGFLVNGFRSLFKRPRTFFEGVWELPAASFARIATGDDRFTPKRYWSLTHNPWPMTPEEAVEGARNRLERSLSLRLRADVPVAFCLSGGVDSTALAGIAARRMGRQLHTFSVVDADERYNESDRIKCMTDWLGCEHFTAQVNRAGFFERMRDLVTYHDAPVPTISYYIHSFLSEEISARGYKVAISGAGADELFTGYYDHYAYWLAEMAKRGDVSHLVEEWRGTYGRWVNNPLLQDPLSFRLTPDRRDHLFQNREMFNALMVEPISETFTETAFSDDVLRTRMFNDLTEEIVPVILRADDSNSMMYSVENRSPFLDRELAEYMYAVPSELLIRDGLPKWILREAVAGDVPDEVRLCSRKQGFNASIDSLIDRTDPQTRERLLSPSPIFDLVDRERIATFLDADLTDNSFSKFAFSFISAKLFLETARDAA